MFRWSNICVSHSQKCSKSGTLWDIFITRGENVKGDVHPFPTIPAPGAGSLLTKPDSPASFFAYDYGGTQIQFVWGTEKSDVALKKIRPPSSSLQRTIDRMMGCGSTDCCL
jgi:hypothetical protein